MNGLIMKARQNLVLANLLAIFFVLVGWFAVQTITVKLFPEIDLETISVTVAYPGATPLEVEDAILKPIEQQIEGLEGVRKIKAVASENYGSVLVSLEAGENQNQRLQDIENEINQITVFPQESERAIIAIAEPDELAIQFIVAGDLPLAQLKTQAERLREQLINRDGIADVRLEAVGEDFIDIAISQDKVRAFGLNLPEVARRIRSQSLDLAAGEIEGTRQRMLVRTLGKAMTGDEFAKLAVGRSENGKVVLLSDIATVQDGLEDVPTAGFYNGKPAIVVSLYRVGKQQIFDLVSQAQEVAENLRDQLPEQVEIITWRDESEDLQSRIDLLIENASIGMGLVMVLLLLFIDLRVAIWVAIGVAVSFVGSFILLAFSGYTINQLSLFGFILAIGIVVDDAIVVGENIFSKREQGLGETEAAIEGTREVSGSVLVATLTTITVFIPLLFIPGIYGQFMGPIAAVVIFVLILSLIESFFILPRHLSHLSDRKPRWFSPRRYLEPLRTRTSGAMRWLIDKPVNAGVNFSVKRPVFTVSIFIGMFALSLLLLTTGTVKFVFFPEIEGNFVKATLELPNETSEQETARVLEQLERSAEQAAKGFTSVYDGKSIIKSIFTTRGVSVGSGDPEAKPTTSAASNLGYVTIKIEDSVVRTFNAIEFERAWRGATGEIPGAKQLSFSSNLVSAGSPVQLEIKSRNEDQAKAVAGIIRKDLVTIEGVLDIQDDRFNTTEEIQLRLKPAAALYNLTTDTIAQQVRAAFFGAVATRVQRDREEVDVRVRLNAFERGDVQTLYDLRINAGEQRIPLGEVAHIEVGQSPALISRKDGKRVVTLQADVDTRVVTGGDVTSALLEKTWQPIADEYPDVEVTLGGDQEEQARAGPAIGRNFAISLFVVYALLALVFQSYSQPLVIMSIIPFGFMGAVLGHFIVGYDLTLLSLFGVIGLSGVVINDSLLLVRFINELLRNGASIDEAVRDATLQRFRPIVLTSLTTCFGVLPIIFERSVQAQFLAPTAVSLGIGILFATFVLMFLLPSLAKLQLKTRQRLLGRAQPAIE